MANEKLDPMKFIFILFYCKRKFESVGNFVFKLLQIYQNI